VSPVGRQRDGKRPADPVYPGLGDYRLVVTVRRVKPYEPVIAGGNQPSVGVEVDPVAIVAVVAVALKRPILIAGVEDSDAVRAKDRGGETLAVRSIS
jgi:hypothetical protein